jgi:hypothetical protein
MWATPRSLGWIITITEKGPKLLEANSPYAPPNFFEPMDSYIKTILNQ